MSAPAPARAPRSAQLSVRHLQPHELPEQAWPQQVGLKINPRWAWGIFDSCGRTEAVLLTAPCHGMLMLVRVWARPGAPRMALRRLFREVAAECLSMGIAMWMVMLEQGEPSGFRLSKLVLRYKGSFTPLNGVLAAGRMEGVCQLR